MRKMLFFALMGSSTMLFAGPNMQNNPNEEPPKQNMQSSGLMKKPNTPPENQKTSSYSQLSKFLTKTNRASDAKNKNELAAATENPVYTENQNSTMAMKTEQDRHLYEKIRNVLHSESLSQGFEHKKYDSIEVSVADGHVTLRGTVESLQDKEAIEKRIKQIDGVVDVNNQLKVVAEHFWTPKDRDEPQNEGNGS